VPELERRTALAVMDGALHQRLATPAALERAHAGHVVPRSTGTAGLVAAPGR
jgi:hypothetical protein